jgi:hypothetical protein
MRYRKLRIAWSVGWGLAAVLLIVLWVRSYNVCDIVSRLNPSMQGTTFGSNDGAAYFIRMVVPPSPLLRPPQPPRMPHGWKLYSTEANAMPQKFRWNVTRGKVNVSFPYWLLVAICATVAFVPWVRTRYSLRTILIATTLVAVVLGLIVWLGR